MDHLPLPDVQFVNVNHRDSWQSAISHCFHDLFKRRPVCFLLLSLLSLGVYPYKQYKKAKKAVVQSLAARKIFYFRALRNHIEKVRKEQIHQDPRQSLNAIFMNVNSKKVSEEEGALEFKAIYFPSEIFLFITNPIRDQSSLKLYRIKTEALDYFKIWREIKKKARINQYRQIQTINLCNKSLREEHCLTIEEIHQRLKHTVVFRKNGALLTKFKELSKAFQEIVLAYQEFEEIVETDSKLFHFLESFCKTSKKDIERLQTYLASRHLPSNLPLENRRQLIQFANQQEIIYGIKDKEILNMCSLILNQYQWEFFLSLNEVSQMTLNLIDWAFEEAPRSIKKSHSFLDCILKNAHKKVIDEPQNFPILSEEIVRNKRLEKMTVDFASEMNREWPSIHFFEKETLLYCLNKSESLALENLIECYREIEKFSKGDLDLFFILEQALSQVGKQGFQEAIQEGILQLLGERPEYFLPVLSNSDITILRKNEEFIEIRYSFEQVILKKGIVQHSFEEEKYIIISQPIQKIGRDQKWFSIEPQIDVAVRKGIA